VIAPECFREKQIGKAVKIGALYGFVESIDPVFCSAVDVLGLDALDPSEIRNREVDRAGLNSIEGGIGMYGHALGRCSHVGLF
jgi:hypothetical protein